MHGVGVVQVRPQLGMRPGPEIRYLRQVSTRIEDLDVLSVKQYLIDHIDGFGNVR